MPPTDYAALPGGSLKLKGAKIDKHKKKPKRRKPAAAADDDAPGGAEGDKPLEKMSERKESEDGVEGEGEGERKREKGKEGKAEEEAQPGAGKTDAERRHEERRRKRLDERLKREGVKTHKERVEELNRYLSGLSEHHDMPRIGPG
ncbi:hypothetical protein MMC11_001267 [Xylographa trunciseda]|nr:hypothetical protein [Xylographa trunciseda]